MIKELNVTNFAIIEDINVSFLDGMTAITGQTGAGKSLIIDCIGLLLGARADLDMIRYGATKATIRGLFSYKNKKINDVLAKYGIPLLSDLEIKREVSKNSSIKVNNVNISLNQLKELSLYLADIHVQNDTLRLINPDNYINIIDSFSDKDMDVIFNDYQIKLLNYKDAYKNYLEAQKRNNETIEKIDLYLFQYNEIQDMHLEKKELDSIEKEINVLLNYDKIFNELNETYRNLESLDNLYDAFSAVKKIKDYNAKYEEYANYIETSYYALDDIRSEIKKEISNLDFSKEYLDNLQIRENEIKKICKKYNKDVEELISYAIKIKLEIDKHDNYDEFIKNVYNDVVLKHKELVDVSLKLQNIREKTAILLEKKLIFECNNLDLANTNFKIEFHKNDLSDPLNINAFLSNGVSTADFLISLNKGEPLKPLNKVASGGELSRIMLGFKAILVLKQDLSFIVFDEIDSGISGLTASKIAKKIRDISLSTQVLCITHLPNVASIADQQLFISKYEENNRTYTKIEKLNNEERIREIAIMISGDRLTENAINNAKELLNQ